MGRYVYYSDKYALKVQTLTSHNAEESENSPESPHLGIKRMRKQCVPGAPPFSHTLGQDYCTQCQNNSQFTHFKHQLQVDLGQLCKRPQGDLETTFCKPHKLPNNLLKQS